MVVDSTVDRKRNESERKECGKKVFFDVATL